MSEPIKNVKLTDGEGNEPYTLVKLADENTKEPYILVKGIGGGGDPTLTLDHIEITTPPDKTVYFEGEVFNPEGMEVTAYFNATIGGEAVTVIKPVTDYEYDHAPLTLQTTVVTITYTYEHVTSASGVGVSVSRLILPKFGSGFLKNRVASTNITSINFVTDYSPVTYDATWDASFDNSGLLTAYLEGEVLNISRSSLYPKIECVQCKSLFGSFYSLIELDLTLLDTSQITDMSQMFQDCRTLTELNLNTLNTSNVTNMAQMFQGCLNLVDVTMDAIDTSKVTTMSSMFNNCTALGHIDVSNFNTSNVTDMSLMFTECHALTSLDISNFNTTKVTNMSRMFNWCYSLRTLNMSGVNTSAVNNMQYMFGTMRVLESLIIGLDEDTQPQPLLSDNRLSTINTLKVYVPAHLVNAYKSAPNWLDVASKIIARS